MQTQTVAISLPGVDNKSGARPRRLKSVTAWIIITATITKELQIFKRYLPNLIGDFTDLGIRMFFLMVLASTISMESKQIAVEALKGRTLYIYIQGAMILFAFQGATLWGPINAVGNDLVNGTLEFLYTNPISRYAYFVGTVLSRALVNLPVFIPFYLILVVYSQVSLPNMLLILLVCVITLTTLTAMGIMVGLLAILWRQVNSVAGVLERLFEFLSGAYIPLTSFPLFAQYLGYLLPYTWSYDLIHYYSLTGTWHTILPVWQEWVALSVYATIYLIVSRYLLKKVERLAKQKGLHLI